MKTEVRRRIYWDAMLLVYLLDEHPTFSTRVRELLKHSYERADVLLMSCVGLGEVMAGAGKSPVQGTAAEMRRTIDEMGFSYLAFGVDAVDTFSHLRAVHRVKTADAIHLSCAAAAGVDLFLTGDKDLIKLRVPGIHFIAGFENPIL
ncbi:MAG: PIN domain-containing protein [Acidobacteriota bacterium]|nr:PIN domain-containing protein [Acidobacteriota bacterium]